MTRRRMLWQVYVPFLVVTLVSLVALVWFTSNALRSFYLDRLASDLEVRARFVERQVADHLAAGDQSSIDRLCKELGAMTSTRITVIAPAGKVLGDSDERPEIMENHIGRPEISQALSENRGIAIRYSGTLKTNLMYFAIPVYNGDKIIGVVRTSLSISSIEQALSNIRYKVILGGLVAAILAAVASLVISRRISRPLEELKEAAQRFARGELGLKLPLPNTAEIGDLAEAMNLMAGQLNDRIRIILQQRNELEAMLSSMSEGVLAFDNEENLISMNQAASELFDVEPSRVAGRSVHEIIRNPDLHRLVSAALSAGEPVEGEVTLTGSTEKFLQVNGTVLRGGQGNRIGALIVLNDLTRLRQLENLRRDFVANVSHELKTPVTSIKGFVETLLDGAINDSGKALEFLRIISAESNRLNSIIEDILSLSRIEEEDKQEGIILERMKIRPALESAIRSREIKASEKSIKISLSCPPDLTAKINAPLLEHAVVNLVDNAIKYSPPESDVHVSCRRRDDSILINVKDEGCGISPQHLPRVFERFYRVDKARSRQMGGTGLGLAIVKHIVLAHKGKVSVESKVGEGSTFTISLPCQETD
jgi:two-component system phosphate regulon sensor histidine kinase PhoR